MCIEEEKRQAASPQAPGLEFTVERSEVVHTILQVAVARNIAVSRPSIPRPWEAATVWGRYPEGARGTLPVLDRFDVSAATTNVFIKVNVIIEREERETHWVWVHLVYLGVAASVAIAVEGESGADRDRAACPGVQCQPCFRVSV